MQTDHDWTVGVSGSSPSGSFKQATRIVVTTLESTGNIVGDPAKTATTVMLALAQGGYRPNGAVGEDWTQGQNSHQYSAEFYCCVSSVVGVIQRHSETLKKNIYAPTAEQAVRALVRDCGLTPARAAAA